MRTQTWTQYGRDLLTVAVTAVLLIGPAGCRLQSVGGSDGFSPGDLTSLAGFYIDSDARDGAILAARNDAGDSFFVFGTRDVDGAIEQVEQILVRTADGQESFIAFDSGRPIFAQGPDGSYLNVLYDQVEPTRLMARVELFNAADRSVQTFPVEIDLQQAASAIAQRIRELTGRDVPVTEVTDSGVASKSGPAQVRVTIFSPLFAAVVVPFVLLVNAMTVIVGQILSVLSAIVTTVVYSVLLVVLTPFFAITQLLSDAIVRIQLVPLGDVFSTIPPPATIVLFGA